MNKTCVYGEYTIIQTDGDYIAYDTNGKIIAKAESVDEVIKLLIR